MRGRLQRLTMARPSYIIAIIFIIIIIIIDIINIAIIIIIIVIIVLAVDDDDVNYKRMNIVLAGVRGTLGMTATPVLELWRLCLKPLQVIIQILIVCK